MVSSLIISFDPPLPLNRLFVSERFVRIIHELNIVERYFDNKMVKEMFEYYDKNAYRPLISALLTATKLNMPVYISTTGVFLEMASKYDQELFKQIYAASASGKLKVLPSTFYGGLYPLCESSGEEIGEQLKLVSDLIGKYNLNKASVGIMPYLFYNESVEKGAKLAGIETVVTEEVNGFTDHRFVYTNVSGDLKIAIRNRELSEALSSGSFENINSKEGIIYLSAEELASKGEKYAEIIGNLIYNGGLELVELPPIKNPTTGTLYAPQKPYLFNLSYSDGSPLWYRSKAQTMLLDKMCALYTYVKWLGDQKLLQVWRILMQSDLFFSLIGENTRRAKLIADPDEAKIVYSYILSDFEGKIATMVLKKKEKSSETEIRSKL
ncbi:MAG: hypothetical protein ACP5LF_02895 [Nitrososphaeria archaeon]|nr:hypothetical protein [Conexivisphaerales archaeon]